MNDVLAREAGNVRARATDELALDNGCTMTLPRHRPRQILSRFAASDYENVVAVHVRHVIPLPNWRIFALRDRLIVAVGALLFTPLFLAKRLSRDACYSGPIADCN